MAKFDFKAHLSKEAILSLETQPLEKYCTNSNLRPKWEYYYITMVVSELLSDAKERLLYYHSSQGIITRRHRNMIILSCTRVIITGQHRNISALSQEFRENFH